MIRLGKHARRKQKNRYHANSAVPRQILRACPASSASAECIFSIYDLVCSKIRKSLDLEKAEKLVKAYPLIMQS